MSKPNKPALISCLCGSGKTLDACCLPLIDGDSVAPTAEALMRSRYTAYALNRADYLLATWHTSTRPAELDLMTPPQPKWIGLDVLRHEPISADQAVVEFVARYRVSGRAHRLHETSRFRCEAGHWFYVDGEMR